MGGVLLAGYTTPALAQITNDSLHIYFEPQTITPDLYFGRSEATVGSTVRAVAIINGENDPSEHYYRWHAGAENIGAGIAKGQNTVDIPLLFSDESIISVDVYDKDLTLLATASEFLELSEPEVHFYEDNPLRGMSTTAMGDSYILTGNEIRVRAIPYFMSKDILTNNPKLVWSLDRQTTKNINGDPLLLTLEAPEGKSGKTLVEFYLHNTKNLLQSVSEKVLISF